MAIKYRFIIPGNPIAWKRPFEKSIGNKHWRFDGQKEEKQWVRQLLIKQGSTNGFKTCFQAHHDAYEVNLTFYLPTRKSEPIAKINAKLWGLIEASEKPDIDNLTKFYLDCANDLLWHDDKQVVISHQQKLYSDNPRTVMEVIKKESMNVDENTKNILSIMSPTRLKEFICTIEDLKKMVFEQKPCDLFELWRQEIANRLSKIAQEYADDLKKISKIKIDS